MTSSNGCRKRDSSKNGSCKKRVLNCSKNQFKCPIAEVMRNMATTSHRSPAGHPQVQLTINCNLDNIPSIVITEYTNKRKCVSKTKVYKIEVCKNKSRKSPAKSYKKSRCNRNGRKR